MSDSSNASEILIDTEENRTMIEGNRGNQGVDGGQRESSCAAEPKNSCRPAIGGKAKRFEHFPPRKMTLDLVDVTPEGDVYRCD